MRRGASWPARGAAGGRAYVPERGDVVWIDLEPRAGREQGGHRTCLVLSPALYNGKASLAVLCPITDQVKGYSFEVALPDGLATTGVVLADHIKSLDWRVRRARFRERVPATVVREVLDAARALLEPKEPATEAAAGPGP